MKNPWVIIGVVVAVIFGGSIYLSQQVASKANEGVVITDHIKGNAAAEVRLTEFSDFQCPACAQFYPVVKDLMDQYGDQLAFEYRHFPLTRIHPFAEPAARAAEAAGQQGKFYEFHDLLFENQQTWSNSPNPQAFFDQYAEQLELDVDQFRTHMRSSMIKDKIRSDLNDAVGRGLTGTPSFYLNGERMQYQTFADFVSAVEAALGVAPVTEEGVTPSAIDTVEFGV